MSGEIHSQIVRGAGHILIGMLVLSFVDNFFTIAMEEAGLWQFHTMRTVLMIPVLMLAAKAMGARIWPRNFGRVVLRTLFLAVGMMIYFAGLGFLPIPQVGAGLFTSPIWILIFSAIFYGDRVGIFRIVAMVAGFIGVLIVLRPDVHDLSLLTLMPIASGAFYGMSMLLTRKLCADEDAFCLTSASFIMLGLLGVFGSIWFMLFPTEPAQSELAFLTRNWVVPPAAFWGVMALQVVGSIAALNFLNRAYLIADASYIAVFEYSFLGFAAGWAWLLWGTQIDILTAFGILIIVGSGVVIALRSKTSD